MASHIWQPQDYNLKNPVSLPYYTLVLHSCAATAGQADVVTWTQQKVDIHTAAEEYTVPSYTVLTIFL